MSMNNGLWWALGAVGAFAVGASLRTGAASSTCAHCARPLAQGSRDVEAQEESRLRRGGYLFRQRFDVRAGFFVPLAEIEALDEVYPAFRADALRVARAALAEGGLRGEAFARLAQPQLDAMVAASLGPRSGPAFLSRLERPMSIVDYAMGKDAEDAEKQKAYAAELYAKRAWTLHVLSATGHLSEASRRPVYQKSGSRESTLFDGVTFALTLVEPPRLPRPKAAPVVEVSSRADGMKGMPYLRMTHKGARAGFYFITDIGSLLTPGATVHVPLLTSTTKMSSPSFGLPAGSVLLGGSCPGADVEAQSEMKRVGRERICDVCYATGANYGYANNMTQQEARRRWVAQLLQQHSPVVAGYLLASMIEGYARHTMEGKDRQGQEIGLWDGEAIVVPSRTKVPVRAFSTPLQIQSVDGRKIPKDTRAWFKARRTPKGAVVGFFRIHDSGDFGVGKTADYIEAWREAALLLPHVQFWAPSRIWPMRRTVRALSPEQASWLEEGRAAGRDAAQAVVTWTTRDPVHAQGSPNEGEVVPNPSQLSPGEDALRNPVLDAECDIVNVPGRIALGYLRRLGELPNFALRPSGLYIKRASDDPIAVPTFSVPDAQGKPVTLVGSGVASTVARNTYPPMADTRGVAAWQCPVYTLQADGKEAKSCQAANCRACWLAKDLPVFYGAH